MLVFFQDSWIKFISELENEISKIFGNILKTKSANHLIQNIEIFKDGFFVLPFMPTAALLTDGDELEVKISLALKNNQEQRMETDIQSVNRKLEMIDLQENLSKHKTNKFENYKNRSHSSRKSSDSHHQSKVLNPELINREADLVEKQHIISTELKSSVKENPAKNSVFKKRDIKERQKQLEEIKQEIIHLKPSRSSSSSSSSSSDSSSSSNSSIKSPNIKQSQIKVKITQPNPKLNVLNPVENFKMKKQIWEAKRCQKNENQASTTYEPAQTSRTPYLNQFDVIPKQKMSNKQKETIIDNHLKQLQPAKKDLIKGTKLTPDSYGQKEKRPKSQPKAKDIFIRDKRRDSHGNRAFSHKHKIMNETKLKEASEYLKQGFLLLTNSNKEQIPFNISNSLTKVAITDVKVGDEIIIRAVLFDQAKRQPLDTDYIRVNIIANYI